MLHCKLLLTEYDILLAGSVRKLNLDLISSKNA